MKHDPSELDALASQYDARAATCEAKAHEHAQSREMDGADRETRRAEKCRYNAGMLRHFAGILKTKVKRGSFTKPSWEELLDHCRTKHPRWPHADILAWFNHFESVGWKVNSKPMVSWPHAAANGYRRWEQANPAQSTLLAVPSNGDPQGWREWMKAKGLPYKEYKYAHDWQRTDFRKSK